MQTGFKAGAAIFVFVEHVVERVPCREPILSIAVRMLS
ncbi:hypothetical protein GGQ64_004603 [Rhizobium azooxidifex]|uniref:Uncharacterized protein n=1 Tax=Mycoplana azooxidifex TaxID=1636188 RepID=A0A7W6DGG3_9HYPH|nr:hypothetical protein [Mycoplana azooxidifex]